jgi:hypothetical protein
VRGTSALVVTVVITEKRAGIFENEIPTLIKLAASTLRSDEKPSREPGRPSRGCGR